MFILNQPQIEGADLRFKIESVLLFIGIEDGTASHSITDRFACKIRTSKSFINT